jgi:pyruvate dehydrogenase E2 component (dihydrolipoamide acetyltransferase)
MIKYLELTAPESNDFRQVRIISIEVAEGDTVEIGDTLFRVKSGDNEIDLPSTRAGKICELIVLVGESISVMTPLLLLETEVAGSTATPHINANQKSESSKKVAVDKPVKKTSSKKTKAKKKKKKKKKSDQSLQAEPIRAEHAQPKLSQAEISAQRQSLDLAVKQEQKDMLRFSQATNDTPSDNIKHRTVQGSDKQSISNTSEPTIIKSESNMSNNTQTTKITVPDIGGDNAKVIELHVKVGDSVSVDESLITLESDKASMDVPSTAAGIVKSISAQIDQEMGEGDLILELEASSDQAAQAAVEPGADTKPETKQDSNQSSQVIDVTVPDIGGDSAKVIEILVSVGQSLDKEDPIVTLESDKASMEVPSSAAGTVESIEVSLDQDVTEGVVIIKLKGDATNAADPTQAPSQEASSNQKQTPQQPVASTPTLAENVATSTEAKPAGEKSHASPSIRRFARELGVDLSVINGSSRKGRINKGDVTGFVKGIMTSSTAQGNANQSNSGAGIPEVPAIDFSKFGEIEVQPLNRIKKLTARNLHRSWLNVPHVTHHDESNINDLEAFRKQLNQEYVKQKKDIKLSPLAFIVKAVVNALQTYPQFNSSLEPGGENLILKKYFNIGIAVETPNGLVVPVLKDADRMSVAEIATEMGVLAVKARDKKLTTKDMTGAGFTISSLGGIGGTSFTPIVNAPEVAILGVSRSKVEAIWDGEKFMPGTMLPLSLSYDHRVIDGAEAARFTRQIASVLEDVRRLAL